MTLGLSSASPLCSVRSTLRQALQTWQWHSTSTVVASASQSRTFTTTRQISGPSTPRPPRSAEKRRRQYVEAKKHLPESRAMEKFMTRDFKAGDIYAPHDLSPAEMRKWRVRKSPATDAFDALHLNPLELYKNFSIMSEYMTAAGRIKHRSVTGLRPVNQRKIAKAIRRAIGLGLMPSAYRHPEILAAEAKARMDYGGYKSDS